MTTNVNQIVNTLQPHEINFKMGLFLPELPLKGKPNSNYSPYTFVICSMTIPPK